MRDVKVRVTGENQVGKTFKDIGSEADRMGQVIERSADKAEAELKSMNTAARDVGVGIGVALTAVAAFGQANIKEEQQIRALNLAYGDSSEQLQTLADDLQDMGIASDDSARIAALGAQSLARNYGITADQIAVLVQRSADLSAVSFDLNGNQLNLADVSQRVTAAIRGEGESAEILGLNLSDSAVAAEAAARGMTGWTTTMTEAEKAQFRYMLVLEQTEQVQGAAGDAAETTAGKTRGYVIQLQDMAAEAGAALGPVGDIGGVMADNAVQIALVGVAISRVSPMIAGLRTLATGAAAASALSVALGPVGLVAAGVAAAGAIYYLTQRESDHEEATRKLTEATESYTASIVANTTALAQRGLLDETDDLQAYLDIWINNGLVAQTRIEELNKVQNSLLLDFQDNMPNEVGIWEDLVEGGHISRYTADVLAATDANGDFEISAEELAVAQAYLLSGFELTVDQAARLKVEMAEVTEAMSNPELYGQLIADEASLILEQLTSDVIGVEEAISRLNALPTDRRFNIAAQEAVVVTDALTESIYGGVEALRLNYATIKEGHAIVEEANRLKREAIELAIEEGVAANQQALSDARAQAESEEAAYHEERTQRQAEAAAQLAELVTGYNEVDRAVEGAAATSDVFGAGVSGMHDALAQTNADLMTLASTIERDFAGAADQAYGMVVGFTEGMVNSIDKTHEWIDAFIDFEGNQLLLGDLLARNRIDLEDYNEVMESHTRISEADARATDAMNVIWAKQSDLVADGAVATADYIESISRMNEAEQLLALAWADQDLAARANEIRDMAVGWDDMTTQQQGAFESLVVGAASTDPVLAKMLEQMGLISIGADGTVTIREEGLSAVTDSMERLVDSFEHFIQLMEIQYDIDINQDGVIGLNTQLEAAKLNMDTLDTSSADPTVSDSGMSAAQIALQDIQNQLNGIDGRVSTTTLYVDTIRREGIGFLELATGGVAEYATGGYARLAELSPEMVRYPSGATGLAMHEGIYALPSGSHVSTGAATEGALKRRGRDRAGVTITGPVYVYPAAPDIGDALTRSLLN